MKISNRKDRTTRSAAYQVLYNELAIGLEVMETFSNEESLHKRLNPFDYNEDILLLEEELRLAFWELVERSLTDRQKQILKGLAAGKTQQEIAKSIGINQSSITKSINGNCNYNEISPNGKPTIYGGSRSKIRKLIDEDPKIQDILKQIATIRDESWI
jgi:DNA-binding CsgD family transcriptional regulator